MFGRLIVSHPSRGAWIEIGYPIINNLWAIKSHPSRGAWIEIHRASESGKPSEGRTPRGVRGLKLAGNTLESTSNRSHPSRGAWIEI